MRGKHVFFVLFLVFCKEKSNILDLCVGFSIHYQS